MGRQAEYTPDSIAVTRQRRRYCGTPRAQFVVRVDRVVADRPAGSLSVLWPVGRVAGVGSHTGSLVLAMPCVRAFAAAAFGLEVPAIRT